MAATTKTNAVTSTKLTGADIMAILNRPQNETHSFGEAVVDYTANKLGDISTGVTRLSAAVTVGLRNAGNHYAIERNLQMVRSDAKLRAAADRAAERINALMA